MCWLEFSTKAAPGLVWSWCLISNQFFCVLHFASLETGTVLSRAADVIYREQQEQLKLCDSSSIACCLINPKNQKKKSACSQ